MAECVEEGKPHCSLRVDVVLIEELVQSEVGLFVKNTIHQCALHMVDNVLYT